MLAKVEMLMEHHMGGYNSGRYIPYDSIIPASADAKTQDKEKAKLDSPPPKKANTNSSPSRAIYSLFTPPAHKSNNSQQSNRASYKRHNQPDTHQPMDTDDTDHQQPNPGETTGHQEE